MAQQILFDQDVVLTEFGTFNGEFDLPEDVPIGEGNIRVRYQSDYDATVYFQIAEFRVPEYKVEVTPDYTSDHPGRPVESGHHRVVLLRRAGQQRRSDLERARRGSVVQLHRAGAL